jgi:hypothetical protein
VFIMKTETVEIGISRIVGINCLFGKSPFAILNGLRHERNINYAIPTGWDSKRCSVIALAPTLFTFFRRTKITLADFYSISNSISCILRICLPSD